MMDQKNIEGQLEILEDAIKAYRSEEISLNKLIQRIEGISQFIDIPSWKEEIFPTILLIEQINAANLDAKTKPSADENADIVSALIHIEGLINRIRNGYA